MTCEHPSERGRGKAHMKTSANNTPEHRKWGKQEVVTNKKKSSIMKGPVRHRIAEPQTESLHIPIQQINKETPTVNLHWQLEFKLT